MIRRLKTLQANKAQYPNGRVLMQSLKTDAILRKEIETLSKHFLGKTVRGCSNCYYDIYFQLINLSTEKIMTKKQCQFEIRRGVLLRDKINLDISKNMTQANITDELALYHLKTNPKCVEKFSHLPENWQKMVEAYQIEETEIETQEKNNSPETENTLTSEEKQLIEEITKLLKQKTTKTAIQETYKGTILNGKKLTITRVKDLIKQAEQTL